MENKEPQKMGWTKAHILRVIAYAGMGLLVFLLLLAPYAAGQYLTYQYGAADPGILYPILACCVLLSLPVLAALFTVGRICTLILSDEPFSDRNLLYLSRIAGLCYLEAVISLVFWFYFTFAHDIFAASLLLIILISGAIAVFATVLKELLKSAIRLREENELTI